MVDFPYLAVMVAVAGAPTPKPLIVNVPEVWPAGTVAKLGKVTTKSGLAVSATAAPLRGGAVSVTVPVAVWSLKPTKLVGVIDSVGTGARTMTDWVMLIVQSRI